MRVLQNILLSVILHTFYSLSFTDLLFLLSNMPQVSELVRRALHRCNGLLCRLLEFVETAPLVYLMMQVIFFWCGIYVLIMFVGRWLPFNYVCRVFFFDTKVNFYVISIFFFPRSFTFVILLPK